MKTATMNTAPQVRRSALMAGAAAALAIAAMGFAGAADARDDVSFSVGIGVPGVSFGATNAYPVYAQPVYVEPLPVYLQPQPVYVQPRPVYVQPAPIYYRQPPVYVRPAPVYYGAPQAYYGNPGWGHHGWHDRRGRGDDGDRRGGRGDHDD